MTILNTLKTSTCCVKENHSFYIYRADTHQVLARGLNGYEAAKTAANRIRSSLGLKWNQVAFKKEIKPTGTNSASGAPRSRTRSTGARFDRSTRYNPSKRGHFRGYYGTDGSYHDIDWGNQWFFGCIDGFWNPLVLWMVLVVPMEYWGSLRTARGFLKSSCIPDVLEEPEGVLTESPTGIAYGTSGVVLFFFPCWSWWSGLDALLAGSQELPWGSWRTYSSIVYQTTA